MLHNLDWLQERKPFPPPEEKERLSRYESNLKIFKNDQWGLEEEYQPYLQRIETVVTNFGEYFSFPVLFNYQRLMSLKMADLICGEQPIITGNSEQHNATITDIRDDSNFDTKLYATAIDISRYGDGVWRVYKENGKNTFTIWDPSQWFPIVTQDGTLRITQHVLCWLQDVGTKDEPEMLLHAQIHEKGFYHYRVYKMDPHKGIIGVQVSSAKVLTGLDYPAVMNLRGFMTSDTVYGCDDYLVVDSMLAELMVRVAQISTILDKHADPILSGPTSMLTHDEATGQLYLKKGKFYGISVGEELPQYLTWEGELDAAFRQIELLLNQIYILSELGAALVGSKDGVGQAVSGTALRFKMISPLAKARRITNTLSLPVRQLFSMLSQIGYDVKVERKHVSIEWADGLPDDPNENAALVKLLTGAKHIMPLELAIVEHFRRTSAEARKWIDLLAKQDLAENDEDVNKPGPQDGTGVNPQANASDTGLKGFKAPTNK